MINPLLALLLGRRGGLRRREVPVPTAVGGTDAIFLVLRRLRPPLLWLVGVFSVSVAGLAATPGVDAAGEPHRLSVFESFYVMSYTATTIGFGEIPQPFTTGQRLWVTAMIYATVIGWAYALATMLALAQDVGFTAALTAQRFRREVRRMREPFYLVAGFGESGRSVCQRLDSLDRRCVAVDILKPRIDLLEASEMSSEVPAFVGDAHDPAVLGLAGLGHRDCCGVLALTDDDEVNLSIVQSVALLRPDVPVVARAASMATEQQMAEFGPDAVINPLDRFGNYLVVAMQRPVVDQLVTWLMSPTGVDVPERRAAVPDGTWTVYAEGEFPQRIALDLEGAGFDVRFETPQGEPPDVSGSVGCVVATRSDTTNLAVAAHLRREHPDVLLVLPQLRTSSRPLIEGFGPDWVFVPPDLVARECLTRILSPHAWELIDHAMRHADDDWAAAALARLQERCGRQTPVPSMLVISWRDAPAVVSWLAHAELTIADLTRDFEDRDRHVPVVVSMLYRDGGATPFPDDALPLQVGDELLLYSGPTGRARLREVLFNDGSVEYVATGRHVPATWIWRQLTRKRPVAGPPGREPSSSTGGSGDRSQRS
ncbi:MAG: NAD(P)-binding protein [Nocardioides sp.]